MTLSQWADNGWLKPHQTTREEISDLLAIVARDVTDAERTISLDPKPFLEGSGRSLRAVLTTQPCGFGLKTWNLKLEMVFYQG
jgi:hypothetical protein